MRLNSNNLAYPQLWVREGRVQGVPGESVKSAVSPIKRMRSAARPARSRVRVVCLAAVAAGALLLGAALPASAVPADGFWYVEVLDLDEAHADGATGEGVTVAVIDGQINTAIPSRA